MKYFEFADKLKPKYSPKYSKYGIGLQINMCTKTIDPAMKGYARPFALFFDYCSVSLSIYHAHHTDKAAQSILLPGQVITLQLTYGWNKY
jgi:hypothetical protein